MTVLSQTFFALVRGHLVAFSFLSAGHCSEKLEVNILVMIFRASAGLFHLFHEHFGRLESGDFVLGDDDGGVLGDVAGGLLRAGLDNEAAKTAQVNVVAMCERVLDGLHEFLDGLKYYGFLNAGAL